MPSHRFFLCICVDLFSRGLFLFFLGVLFSRGLFLRVVVLNIRLLSSGFLSIHALRIFGLSLQWSSVTCLTWFGGLLGAFLLRVTEKIITTKRTWRTTNHPRRAITAHQHPQFAITTTSAPPTLCHHHDSPPLTARYET